MEFFSIFAEMIGSLGMPIAVIFVALIFKKELINLLAKLRRFQYGPFSAELNDPSLEELPKDEESEKILKTVVEYTKKRVGISLVSPAEEDIDTDKYEWHNKFKEVYWLGHGLMYTKAVLLTGASKSLVFFGLRQCFINMKNLGFGTESNSFMRLSAMMVLVHKNDEEFLTFDRREEYAQKIQSMIYVLDEIIDRVQKSTPNN